MPIYKGFAGERSYGFFLPYYLKAIIAYTIPITINIIIDIANGIQIGANTHIHDQSITLHSLRTIKAIANAPEKVMPYVFELLFELLLICFLFPPKLFPKRQ